MALVANAIGRTLVGISESCFGRAHARNELKRTGAGFAEPTQP